VLPLLPLLLLLLGAMTSFISAPTELLKIRMQLQKPLPGTPGYLGPWHMLRQLVHSEGVLGKRRQPPLLLLRGGLCSVYSIPYGEMHHVW
jgi:hypothetical protein